MRYCTNCRRLSAGHPPFCTRCGRTYNVRLCPRQHVNSRRADVCSQCGSRDLTQPAPRAHLADHLVAWTWSVLPVVLLIVLASVVVLAMVNAVLTDAQVQGQVVGIVLLVGLGWWAWHQLPGAVRSGMRKAVRWVSKGRTRHDRH